MAQVAFLQERTREAKTHLRHAQRIGRNTKSRVIEWYSLLIDAWFLLKEGMGEKGLHSLRRGFALGKEQGHVHLG
ncbi:MAG: hypothetical protein JW821_06180 [Deltaproteobacteria bacterium]|nr:hypothetical protein [Deltaproteobacteria bacterium]